MQLAMYKGPPDRLDLKIGHAGICFFTRSAYSHCELVIAGRCYSASARDGGVRSKDVDLGSGRWHVYTLPDSHSATNALAWFDAHNGEPYDHIGAVNVGLRILGHSKQAWFCNEAIGAALGLSKPHRKHPQGLLEAAVPDWRQQRAALLEPNWPRK